jgi:tetratricopeptide (TPR) repeat protein
MVRGALQSKHNDPDGAIRTYTDVLRRYRDFAPAQKRLAAIYVSRPADLGKADEMGASARRTVPNDPELLRILGEIKFKQKDYPAAIRLLQESDQRAPLDHDGLYYLGTAQIETTQDAKGRETLQRALTAGLQDPLAEEARRRLRQKQ